jgi:hypothetical protein
MYNQYNKNKIALAIPVLTLIFLMSAQRANAYYIPLKTYRGGITVDTTKDGIKHRQIGIHCSSQSIHMAIVNVLTVIQHRSVMVIMMAILIYGINGYTIINTD